VSASLRTARPPGRQARAWRPLMLSRMGTYVAAPRSVRAGEHVDQACVLVSDTDGVCVHWRTRQISRLAVAKRALTARGPAGAQAA